MMVVVRKHLRRANRDMVCFTTNERRILQNYIETLEEELDAYTEGTENAGLLRSIYTSATDNVVRKLRK